MGSFPLIMNLSTLSFSPWKAGILRSFALPPDTALIAHSHMALITPGELCNHTWRIDTICEPLWCTKHKCCHATWSLRVHITLEYADPVASEKEHDNPSHQKNPGRIQQKAIFAASSCSKPALESGLLDNLLATCPRSLEERGDHKWLKSCATAAWAVKLVHCETNDSDKSQAPADASFKQACRCRRGSSTRQNVATDSYAADSKPSTSRTAIHGTRIQQPHGIKRAREEQADTFNELYDMTSLTNAGKHATNEAQPRTRLDQQSALNYGERKLLKAFRECIEVRERILNARQRD